MAEGTVVSATVSRVVDGDTIRVFLPGSNEDESLRILALDTEESHAGGGKPVTPWGRKAKQAAESFFSQGDQVQLEFPGTESPQECVRKYRGNFGRLLVFVHKEGVDYQEMMIREGYSPYFTKYGNARFVSNHERYVGAEREAQMKGVGVWDQVGVNGSEIRNYALLSTWWKLRAEVIERYRSIKDEHDQLLNTRLDYSRITQLAGTSDEVAVFTELRGVKRVGGRSAVVGIGSREQPFSLFIPDVESTEGEAVIQLMETRYISTGESHPRRGYAYVKGSLTTFRDKPQMVVEAASQITDEMKG